MNTRLFSLLGLTACAAATLLVSCSDAVVPRSSRTQRLGQTCGDTVDCRSGLACVDGLCATSASLTAGATCDLTANCADGLFCTTSQTCQTAGSGTVGQSCIDSRDCERGLHCGFSGIFTVCSASGSVDVGGACTQHSECMAGLGCDGATCKAGIATSVVAPFEGVSCEGDSGAFRAYYQVPREGEALTDFFRLPFPNEARVSVKNGSTVIDLTGFPSPQSGPTKSLIDAYLAAAQSETDGGFGTNQTITMRFSGAVDKDSLKYNTADATLYFFEIARQNAGESVTVDASKGCDARSSGWKAQAVSGVVLWSINEPRAPYMCQNHLTFRPRTDNPLKPNALYALILTKNVRAKADSGQTGEALAPDTDLTALLDTAATTIDSRLQRSHECHAPLRAALSTPPAGMPGLDRIAALAFFRTQDVPRAAKAIANTMGSLPANATAKITALSKCEAGTVSPCHVDGETGRDCPATPDTQFDEYHGRLRMPVLQAGTRPYVSTADGGYIEYSDGASTRRFARAGDKVVVKGSEEVCFALTTPKSGSGAIPIAIYGHGTGGDFRSFVREGLAAQMAANTSPTSVISFDQPMHGSRRPSDSTLDASRAYFNMANPQAARDNALQALVDYLQVVELLKAMDTPSADPFDAAIDSTLAATLEVRLAGATRLFIGHSQGAVNGAIFSAVTPDVVGAVWSGSGGGLTQSLLDKEKPINFRNLVPALLTDSSAGSFHPVLGLLQMVAERSDAINFGRYMNGRDTTFTAQAKSLLNVIGVDDSFTPNSTASDLWATLGHRDSIFAADAQVEATGILGGLFRQADNSRNAPLKILATSTDVGSDQGLLCNCTTSGVCGGTPSADGTGNFTSGTIVYRPTGTGDGHFVLFEHPAAKRALASFVATVGASQTGFCTASGKPTIAP